jgi:NAD(P)-dependent dehydrogenase (short-subunit alcohol dehydrogenase family)
MEKANKMLSNKKIIVAGAGGLLGGEVVASALNLNAKVVAIDIDINAIKSTLKKKGIDKNDKRISLVALDLTDEEAVKSFFDNQSDITGAVNSSYPRNKAYGASLFDVSLANFNENVSLHLGSAFLFSQQCAAYFLNNKCSFSLINISSVYGVVAPKFSVYEGTSMTMPVEYAAIKSAILHLNKYFSAYINDSKFRVNSVSPGGILNDQPPAFLEKYKDETLGKGMLDINDIMGSIMFLLSEQSKYVNGQNIIVDDGFTL